MNELEGKLNELEKLRDRLYEMLEFNNCNPNEILAVSQELDKIIVCLYKVKN